MLHTYTSQPMSLPRIKFLYLTFSEKYPDKISNVKVTTSRSEVKPRSHHDKAYLRPLTNVPTMYQLAFYSHEDMSDFKEWLVQANVFIFTILDATREWNTLLLSSPWKLELNFAHKNITNILTVFHTYSVFDTEDVAVEFTGGQVFSDVGEVVEVVSILTRTENVTDFMLTNHLL